MVPETEMEASTRQTGGLQNSKRVSKSGIMASETKVGVRGITDGHKDISLYIIYLFSIAKKVYDLCERSRDSFQVEPTSKRGREAVELSVLPKDTPQRIGHCRARTYDPPIMKRAY